jgi:hypothetical protein
MKTKYIDRTTKHECAFAPQAQLRVEHIPHGGPLKFSPNIAKLFLARIATCTAGNCDTCGEAAVAEVKRLVKTLTPEQRGYTRLVADSVSEHCGP